MSTYAIIGAILAAGAALAVATLARRAVAQLVEALDRIATAAERTPTEGGTDPALIERIEAAERRVEGAVDDITRRYRKLAQERRRVSDALGLDDEDPEEVAQAAASLREALSGPTTQHSNAAGARRRLVKRR